MANTFLEAKGALDTWLANASDPGSICLHVSHDDLDGHASSLMIKASNFIRHGTPDTVWDYFSFSDYGVYDTNMYHPIIRRDSIRAPKYTYYATNCRAGTADVEKAILDWIPHIEDNNDYKPGKVTLRILITDHSGLSLSTVKKLQDGGHKFTIVVIDHHVGPQKDLADNMPDNVTYYTDRTKSAALILYSMIIEHIANGYYAQDAMDRFIKAVGHYAQNVSQYDTGNWGDWDPDTEERIVVSNAIYEQFVYMTINSVLGPDGYFRYMYYRLMNDAFGEEMNLFMSQANMGGATELLSKMAFKQSWDRLVDEYRWVQDNIQYSGEISFFGYLNADGAKMHVTLPKPMRIGRVSIVEGVECPRFYSMISKKLLEDPETKMDLFVLSNTKRGTIELRSANDEINCAEIAIANGGGGHPRAAGFPMKKI